MSFSIEEELKKLPARSGVYLMHDENDEIIYVGKALSLKNRVRQYFQKSRNKGPKIEKMVPLIKRFEYIITDSELEALILECNLIKEYRPKYNTLLKDDKTYPYIEITLGENYPRVLFTRKIKKGKSKYFGPYPSAGDVKEAIELVRKLYCIRKCNQKLPQTKETRPCLYHHIHQCSAPCQNYITKEEYRRSVDGAIAFLNGDCTDKLAELEEKMMAAAADMRFEEAAEIRDLIGSVKAVLEKQKANINTDDDWDISALAREGKDVIVQMFFLRGGRLIGREHYYLEINEADTDAEILKSFLTQFYSGTPFIPKQLMLSGNIEDKALLEEWLSVRKGSKVTINIPQKGKKEKLVELALQNARIVLNQDKDRIKKEEKQTSGAINELGELLGMTPPHRIEAYDISNISGYQSVGSMIVYEGGKPKRADYRKFRIKTVVGPDDYASMEEVLSRRFERAANETDTAGFERLPDLILMDGGKGQVNVCLRVLEKFGINIPVCGMVKDDKHRTRGLYYNNEECLFGRDSEAFHLVTRIQDEAHRFAITYHKLLRSKGQVHSILDDIPGIGPARRKTLMKYYNSIEDLKNAGTEELKELPSMDLKSAEAVYRFFHKGED